LRLHILTIDPHREHRIRNGDGVEQLIERQDILEGRAGQAIRDQRRPFGFQEEEFRPGPFWE
jgi:hypothetical protein